VTSLSTVVIDASNLILGRMASHVAKRLLAGERIVIVNAEKAVISGSKKSIVEEYKDHVLAKRRLKDPEKGPKKIRRPDLIVKLTVRGMLPYKKPRGLEAYKRLKVYIGVPREYEGSPMIKVEEADASKLSLRKFMTVGELAALFGWPPPKA